MEEHRGVSWEAANPHATGGMAGRMLYRPFPAYGSPAPRHSSIYRRAGQARYPSCRPAITVSEDNRGEDSAGHCGSDQPSGGRICRHATRLGGTLAARFWRITLEQLQEKILAHGLLSASEIELHCALLEGPQYRSLSVTMMSVWGGCPQTNLCVLTMSPPFGSQV